MPLLLPRHCDCLSSKSWENIKKTSSVSGLFLIKRHPLKYMHRKKPNKKTLLFSKSDAKQVCYLLRGRFLVSRLCVTSLNNGRKKTPRLIRVTDNQPNFNLDMYLRIPFLLQNKPLIWRPLGYCELSVSSFNMLFSLLTAADFLYQQFWEFDSWSKQSLPTRHNYVYFQQPSVR